MKRVVAFPLQAGGTVLVEVNEPEEEGGTVRAGRASDLAGQVVSTFEQALGAVKPAAESIITALRGLSEEPSAISVTFGLKLSAEAGAFIASASAEANFTVTLAWQHGAPTAPAQH